MNSTANKNFLQRLFSHNIVLLILAFILSFVAWIIINMTSGTETKVTVDNIPVTIELSAEASDDGLKVYNGENITASVEITGNRVIVGSLSASDISVTADQSSSIISPGSYTLPLVAKKAGIKSNYNIVSVVTPSSVTVFVDHEAEEKFNVENLVVVNLDDDENYYASRSLSHTQVTLVGPETMVNRIKSVAVKDEITPDGTGQQVVNEKLIYLDANGDELDLPLVTSKEDVTVTVQVLPCKAYKTDVKIVNAPDDSPKVTVNPSTVKIAGPQENLDSIKSDTIVIDTIDFSEFDNSNIAREINISAPDGCKVVSDEKKATVKVDLSSYSKTAITCKIASELDSTQYSTVFNTTNVSIAVCGSEDKLSELTASDVKIVADFTGLLDNLKKDATISVTAPLNITLSSSYSDCWVYGTYSVEVNVKKLK